MSTPVLIESRCGGATLPVETYTPQRERQFDAAEAELAELLAEPLASPAAGGD